MTDNQVQVAMEHLMPYMPNVSQSLRPKLQAANESCMDGLMGLKMKSRTAAILLSIFLAGIGGGRFYLGDKGLGIAHVVATVISYVFVFVLPILGIILSSACGLWNFIEIFLVAKKVKWDNYNVVMNYLSRYTQG